MATRYDVIVVGGGSAGSIVAAGLSEAPGRRVLVLEGGPDAEHHPETLTAGGYKEAFTNDALLYERFSVSDRRWGNRPIFLGTGRGLGGSGSVNAMVYTRGAREDYDAWPKGWRWNDVAGDFAALEEALRPAPLPSTQFTEACIAAAETQGMRRSEDLNDGDLRGVLGHEAMNRDGSNGGARRSSYRMFLRPARERANLEVRTGARALRLTFEDGRATGVVFDQGGSPEVARLAEGGELVLAAGALETPALLLRSGIGPDQELRRHGIAQVAELREVGRNLHDHPNVPMFFRGRRPLDANAPQLYGFARFGRGRVRDGEGWVTDLEPEQPDSCLVFYPARSSFLEGLVRLVPGMVLPESLREGPARHGIRAGLKGLFRARPVHDFVESMWGIVVILGKPKSRGTLTLASADPSVPAVIDPGYLAEPDDLETLLAGMEKAEAIARTGALAGWYGGPLSPSGSLAGLGRVARIAYLRAMLMTTYHFAGTVRMGRDKAAPVDPESFALRGVAGVRVADASLMPVAPVAALNAPSMLIGWRASARLRDELMA
ncbi:MAG: GMC family oxidoreductase [Myxococcota bacterium]